MKKSFIFIIVILGIVYLVNNKKEEQVVEIEREPEVVFSQAEAEATPEVQTEEPIELAPIETQEEEALVYVEPVTPVPEYESFPVETEEYINQSTDAYVDEYLQIQALTEQKQELYLNMTPEQMYNLENGFPAYVEIDNEFVIHESTYP